jgi:hypothetical protein
MKKLLLTTAVLAIAVGATAQGTVQFKTRDTLATPAIFTQVFGPSVDNTYRSGNTAQNLPAGGQTYTGAPLTGTGWTAGLWSVSGSVIPAGTVTPYGVIDNSLVQATPTTTFRTGTSAGSVALTTATLANVAVDASSAVLQVRVWPSSFGSWANAVSAFNLGDPLAAIGASPMFVVNGIGGLVNTAPQMDGIVSFSLVTAVPEPSSFVLAGMGLASLLIFRRRK